VFQLLWQQPQFSLDPAAADNDIHDTASSITSKHGFYHHTGVGYYNDIHHSTGVQNLYSVYQVYYMYMVQETSTYLLESFSSTKASFSIIQCMVFASFFY